MHRIALFLVVLLGASPVTAEEFHWPWDHHTPGRRYHREARPANCGQVKEAVAVLDASTFTRAMIASSERERAAIWKCLDDKH